MSILETLLLNQFATFTLVLGRVGGLIMTAPIFGTQAAPMRFRAMLAVSISLLISPLLAMNPPSDMTNLMVYAKYIGNEMLVGVLLGFGVTLLLSGIQVTGQIVSQLSGTALADVFDPNTESTVSVFSQLFYFLTLAMFALLGGHRLVMDALLDTYTWLPPGGASLGNTYVEVLTSLLSQSFLLGIRAAAPAMTALLLATLVLGLVGRTMPQINVLAVGFSVNALLSLGCLLLTVGTITWAFPQQAATAINMIREALHDSVAPG
jgi:flagellar biosynthetic protein FliR